MAAAHRHRQGDLFAGREQPALGPSNASTLPLQAEQIEAWQDRLSVYQGPLFDAGAEPDSSGQLGLFGDQPAPGVAPATTAAAADPELLARALNPHSLRDQHLQFWRWPAAPQQGAALYLVLDRPARLAQPLLLYVGETGRADQRWKGEHDCKGYLAAYSEALHAAGLGCHLSIRFWCDVPSLVRPRRALEQALIRRWLPPFNKETRERWATPFTALAE